MAKTLRQLLTAVRSNLSELKSLRYVSSVATADGATTGLTLIDSALSSYKTDHFVGAAVKIASDQRRPIISAFDPTTGTITVGDGATAATGFGIRVANGAAYEIVERGIFDDAQLIEWANEVQSELLNLLSDDALVTVAKTLTAAGSAGDAALPTDFIRLISLLISSAAGGSTYWPAVILNPDEEWRFTGDSFIGTAKSPVAVFRGGRVKFRPAQNLNLLWTYIGKLADISASQDLQWPDDFFSLLCDLTTAKAFMSSEDFTSAGVFAQKAYQQIQSRNLQSNDTELSKMMDKFAASAVRQRAA